MTDQQFREIMAALERGHKQSTDNSGCVVLILLIALCVLTAKSC